MDGAIEYTLEATYTGFALGCCVDDVCVSLRGGRT